MTILKIKLNYNMSSGDFGGLELDEGSSPVEYTRSEVDAITEIRDAFIKAKESQGDTQYNPSVDGYLQVMGLEANRGTKLATPEWKNRFRQTLEGIFGTNTATQILSGNPKIIRALNYEREKSSQVMLPRVEGKK